MKVRLHEPYRSFFLYLTLLYLNANEKPLENIKHSLEIFPETRSSYPNTSLSKLQESGLIEYETVISDYNVKLKKVPIDSALESLLKKFKFKPLCSLDDDLTISLEDLFNKKQYLIKDVVAAFYDSNYTATFDPKEGKIKIKYSEKKDDNDSSSAASYSSAKDFAEVFNKYKAKV